MLPTFVIGLREGLEAALIVGIIAAFLRKQGRRDLLRWVFLGVATAILLCASVGVALNTLSADLPQKQQEGLETVIGILAVGMVTYMVVWMRRHSRELKGQLENLAAGALGSGGSRAGRAMVLMALLAVLREGFETVVFLLAAFNESGSGAAAGLGALLGILLAAGLGYGIYRGGVRINLSKFFRATGLVLVLVAAGLVVNALHTAHEAGWLNAGQGGTVDLTWLVRPGSVQSSLLTGMLGVQTHPVVIEVIGWLVYLVPVGIYVAWPPGQAVPRRTLMCWLAATAGAAVLATATLSVAVPGRPATNPATAGGASSAELLGSAGATALLRTVPQYPAGTGPAAEPTEIALRGTGSADYDGIATDVYIATLPGTAATGLPATLTSDQLARLNGGRLPIGVRPSAAGSIPVRYADSSVLSVWIEPRTGRILDLRWSEEVRVSAVGTPVGEVLLPNPAAAGTAALPAATVAAAAAAARRDLHRLDRRAGFVTGAWACGALAVIALLAVSGLAFGLRRAPARTAASADPDVRLVRS